VATKPTNASPKGSYPDQPPTGTTEPQGGAKTRRTRTAKQPPRFPTRIARIETVTMTPEEFDNAAEALAILLHAYWRQYTDKAA
jgi:hypothetical protein